MDPVYTPQNCHPAYQLDWSYSLFWHEIPRDWSWFPSLQQACEPDGIRLLEHAFSPPHTSQFLVSTLPHVSPLLIAQRLKGRLQYLLRGGMSNPFRRNYGLRSIGSTRRAKLEQYLAIQLEHHPLADPRAHELLARFQIHHPEVDLAQSQQTTHARYWHNLHLVFVNDGRWREIRERMLKGFRDRIEDAARVKGHLLSRAAILPDHVHVLLGCPLECSPEEIALSYMNNLAHVAAMKAIFQFSYYVGTFSEYDLGVIPRPREENVPVS
jgi:REP element-mobilizing transposase RayT